MRIWLVVRVTEIYYKTHINILMNSDYLSMIIIYHNYEAASMCFILSLLKVTLWLSQHAKGVIRRNI